MMNSTAHAANLHAILTDNDEIRSLVSHAVRAYEQTSSRDSRGIGLSQMLDPNRSPHDAHSRQTWGRLASEDRQLLNQHLQLKHGYDFRVEDWQASGVILDQTSIGGVRYARKSVLKADQDSYIIYAVRQLGLRQVGLPGDGELVPAQIANIFRFAYTTSTGNYTTTFLVVNPFTTTPIQGDPYRSHHALFGYLCPAEPVQTVIIEADQVESHFALTPRNTTIGRMVHILPLSRVRVLSFGSDETTYIHMSLGEP